MELNNKAYSSPSSLNELAFREQTLELLNKTVTKDFLTLIHGQKIEAILYGKGSYMDEETLYLAGRFIAPQLYVYPEAMAYMDYLHKRYGDELQILFLTAGYTPFIQGVVDQILHANGKGKLNYQVFGSSLTFSKGRGNINYLCLAATKRRVVKNIIARQGHIVFIADDEISNHGLFNSVTANGGKALRISHQSNHIHNQSWAHFIQENLSVNAITTELMKSGMVYGFGNTDALKKKYSKVFKKFSTYINKIGIAALPLKKYYKAQKTMGGYIESNLDRDRWIEIFNRLTFRNKSSILLRGPYYYHWLPSYIFVDSNTNHKKWKIQVTYALEALTLLYKYNVLAYWHKLSVEEQFLVLCIIDHYKNGVFSALNTIYAVSIKDPETISDKLLAYLDVVSEEITDLYYQLVFDRPNQNTLAHIVENHNFDQIVEILQKYPEDSKQGMRELDDPHTILLSVLSVLEKTDKQKKQYDMIVDFPCGGLELGLAFLSVFKILFKDKKPPTISHCFYSSKKIKRDVNVKARRDKPHWLFYFIPKHYHAAINNVLKHKGRILLYDNNATTFGTLTEVKQFFFDTYHLKTDAVVTAIYYSNISKSILGQKSEELLLGWQKILDYNPVANYISAFNTWNTSEKSNILESTFFESTLPINFVPPPSIDIAINTSPLFKVCRVHNCIDLFSSLACGANMIGIHAVYPANEQYESSQRQYFPLETLDKEYSLGLPVSKFEVKSIAAMQKYIPRGLKQVLIFEKPISITTMRKTIEAYKLKDVALYVQLQHRVDAYYIARIKKTITRHIIATIGIFQDDFYTYFEMLDKILNPDTDFILIDMSKHQPDVINNNQMYDSVSRMGFIQKIAPLIGGNKTAVLIADDTQIHIMQEYLSILKKSRVKTAGIDMQNNLEISPHEQKYRMIRDKGEIYQVRIRKSNDILAQWSNFITSARFKSLFGE